MLCVFFVDNAKTARRCSPNFGKHMATCWHEVCIEGAPERRFPHGFACYRDRCFRARCSFPSSDAPKSPPETAPLTVTVKSFDPESSNQEPLEGVEVCQLDDTTNCVVTNADGEATLVLPVGQDTGYTIGQGRICTVVASDPHGAGRASGDRSK